MDEVTKDKYLGSLHRNASFYCTARTTRIPLNSRCCTPRNSDQVRLLVSKKKEWPKNKFKFWDAAGINLLNGDKKVVYLVHGFLEKISWSPWVGRVRDAYLKLGADWGKLNQRPYYQAVANVRTVGAVIAYSILKWNVSLNS